MTKEIHLLTTDIPSEVLNLLTDSRIILGGKLVVNRHYFIITSIIFQPLLVLSMNDISDS